MGNYAIDEQIAAGLYRRLAVPFLWLCCCIVGLAVAQGCDVFSRAFFGQLESKVGWVPWLGKLASKPIHWIAQKINSYISGWEHYFEARVARSFEALASLVEDVGIAMYEGDLKAYHLARRLNNLIVGLIQTKVFGEHVARQAKANAQSQALPHKVNTLEHRIAKAAPVIVVPKLGRLEHQVEHVIEWDLPHLRARTRTIENELGHFFERAKATGKYVVTTAFVGAVAVALGRLGLGWLRCTSLRNLGKQFGCGGWKLLEDLLAGVIDVLVIADLCQLTKLLIEVAQSSEVQSVLSGIIGGLDELLLCQGVTRPADVDGYWTEPPPLQTFAALPVT